MYHYNVMSTIFQICERCGNPLRAESKYSAGHQHQLYSSSCEISRLIVSIEAGIVHFRRRALMVCKSAELDGRIWEGLLKRD